MTAHNETLRKQTITLVLGNHGQPRGALLDILMIEEVFLDTEAETLLLFLPKRSFVADSS
jgi:hypothetical protein